MKNNLDTAQIIDYSYSIGFEKIAFLKTDDIKEFRHELFADYNIIITAAVSYNYIWNITPSETEGYIARYTTANFYKLLRNKLKKLSDYIYEQHNQTMPKKQFSHISVNSNLNDKYLAYKSGLGKVLANSLISINNKGPRFVIGNLLLNIDKEPDLLSSPEKFENTCKTCRLCMKKCPTKALKDNGKVDKLLCMQHFSSYIEDSNIKLFLRHWNKRFFGCTDCVDICPLNNQNALLKDSFIDIPGYIGNTIDISELLRVKKAGDLKNKFTGNQLGASWIDETVLIRNLLLANKDKSDILKEFRKNITESSFNEDNIKYLLDIIEILGVR